jgi:hypothetical protein
MLRFRAWTTMLLAASLLAPSQAGAGKLSWKDVVARPETWPDRCRVEEAHRFVNASTVEAGQEVVVRELRAKEVVMVAADGVTTFVLPPGGTDCLDAANRHWKQLSDRQRSLTYRMLAERPDLWPREITLAVGVVLGDEVQVSAGEHVRLNGFDGAQALVQHERTGSKFRVHVQETDVLDRARVAYAAGGAAPPGEPGTRSSGPDD